MKDLVKCLACVQVHLFLRPHILDLLLRRTLRKRQHPSQCGLWDPVGVETSLLPCLGMPGPRLMSLTLQPYLRPAQSSRVCSFQNVCNSGSHTKGSGTSSSVSEYVYAEGVSPHHQGILHNTSWVSYNSTDF